MIILSDKSRFFIAICKSGEHSWLTLGAIDAESEQKHTLAYVGKRLTYRKDYGCQGRMKSVYGSVEGVLASDYRFKNALQSEEKVLFEYKAFEISYENYEEFAKQLKILLKDKYQNYNFKTALRHKTRLYYPSQKNPYHFDLIDISDVPYDEKFSGKTQINGTNIERLSTRDNCRHTVISLLESFLPNGKQMTKGISKFAYQNLPYKAAYHQDKIVSDFYILPVPPEMYPKPDQKTLILNKLYKRLAEIPKLNPISGETKSKFNSVKALYDKLADNGTLDTSSLISRINEWENAGQAKIIDHRRLFWTPATKTRVVIEEVKKLAENDTPSMQ